MNTASLRALVFASALAALALASPAFAEKVVISNWDGYMPKDMAEKFKAETFIPRRPS